MAHAQLLTPAFRQTPTLPCLTPALAELAAEIEAACGAPPSAMKDRITAALEAAAACASLLAADQRVVRPDRYARHILYGDPAGRFTILALVWAGGQFSPAHGHHTWCGYAVHAGTLTETAYAFDAAAMTARPLRAATRHAGYCHFEQAGPDHVHRLGNAARRPRSRSTPTGSGANAWRPM